MSIENRTSFFMRAGFESAALRTSSGCTFIFKRGSEDNSVVMHDAMSPEYESLNMWIDDLRELASACSQIANQLEDQQKKGTS